MNNRAVLMGTLSALGLGFGLSIAAQAQTQASPLAPYIRENAPVLVLDHVTVIDGTGAAPQADMRIVLDHGKIAAVEKASAGGAMPAGGLLIAGCDPTGYGAVLPGFGDQRNLELLVDAGFTPVEAIRIATLNGATYLGKEASIGSIAAGKDADMVVLEGNPAEKIENVEKVETVFKDGVGYDSAKLIESVRGMVGLR